MTPLPARRLDIRAGPPNDPAQEAPVSQSVPSNPPFTTRPQLAGTFGMVASTHWLASAAGMSVLGKGGNTSDAPVPADFLLQVVEPHLNGPGGEVPVIASLAGG